MTVEKRILLYHLQEKMKGQERFCKEIGLIDVTKNRLCKIKGGPPGNDICQCQQNR